MNNCTQSVIVIQSHTSNDKYNVEHKSFPHLDECKQFCPCFQGTDLTE